MDAADGRVASTNALECVDESVLFVDMDTNSPSEYGDDWNVVSPFSWTLDANGLDIFQ